LDTNCQVYFVCVGGWLVHLELVIVDRTSNYGPLDSWFMVCHGWAQNI